MPPPAPSPKLSPGLQDRPAARLCPARHSGCQRNPPPRLWKVSLEPGLALFAARQQILGGGQLQAREEPWEGACRGALASSIPGAGATRGCPEAAARAHCPSGLETPLPRNNPTGGASGLTPQPEQLSSLPKPHTPTPGHVPGYLLGGSSPNLTPPSLPTAPQPPPGTPPAEGPPVPALPVPAIPSCPQAPTGLPPQPVPSAASFLLSSQPPSVLPSFFCRNFPGLPTSRRGKAGLVL